MGIIASRCFHALELAFSARGGSAGPAPLTLTAAIHFACEPLFGGCSLTSVFLRTHPLLTPLVSQPCSDNSPALALRVLSAPLITPTIRKNRPLSLIM